MNARFCHRLQMRRANWLTPETNPGEMRFIPMRLVNPRIPLLAAMILVLSAASSGESRADLSPIARDFRNFCHSLKLKCAASGTARKAPSRNTSKSAAPLPDKQVTKAAAPADTPAEKSTTIVPIPRSKPAAIGTESKSVKADAQAVANPLPEEKPGKKVAILVPPQKEMTNTPKKISPAVPDNDCLASLRNSGVEFETIMTSVGNGACHVNTPVKLHAVQTRAGKIALPDAPILNCRFARQFALWLSDTGASLVSTQLDVKLAKVSTGPGYECRGRNGDSSAKLSAHAFGDAVDITTITTADGRSIQISDAANPASPSFQVLRGLRTTACGYFSTVLGPGSNTAHASHFHLDMEMHGKSRNYRICQ